MKDYYVETDYYKCRKNAERAFLKRRIKQLGIQWFIKRFFIWICFLFVPAHIGCDIEDLDGNKRTVVTYAKKLFGVIYITKEEIYLDKSLIRKNKLKLKDMFIPGMFSYKYF